jgi:hypothetical protein
VRIVKQGRVESCQHSQVQDKHESEPPKEREIVSTIKGWIADRERRRRLSERSNWDILIRFGQ